MNLDIFINICIIYSIKSLYIVPKEYSKLFYIYFCSPLVLCNGFYNTQVVSKKYWKFLITLCYPNIKQIVTYEGDCSAVHTHKKDCYNLTEFNKMLQNIFLLYLKYYSLHGIYLLCLKKQGLKDVLNKEILNIFKSTSFLFLKNLFQRLVIFSIPNIKPVPMYLLSSLCSNPIIFENESRVSQINTMMLSNITIGGINKFVEKYKNNITLILLLLSFYKRKKLHNPTLMLSIINGLTEYTSIKKLNILNFIKK